jgi:hypothetical protein
MNHLSFWNPYKCVFMVESLGHPSWGLTSMFYHSIYHN